MTQLQQNTSGKTANDIKKVAKGAGISFIGSIIGRFLWFACQVIIARFFGAEVFGLYVLGLVVLKVAALLSRAGLHSGAMRFVSIYRKTDPGKVKGTIISALLISLIIGISLGGIVFVSAGFISVNMFHNHALTDIIKTFALCVPFMASMMVVAVASRGFHTVKYLVYTKDIIQPSVNILLIAVFILSGYGIFGVIIAFVISHIIALFAGFYFITRQCSAIKARKVKPVYETKKLLKYSAPLLFSGFLGFFIAWTDTIMLGSMMSTVEVGFYRAASQIPIFLMLFLSASNSIYAPTVAELHHKGQKERMEKIFKSTTRLVFLCSAPAALLLAFSAKEIMVIYGASFIEIGSFVLVFLTIAQFVNCITGGVTLTLNMTGKQNIDLVNTVGMVVINIILNYFFILAYGAIGAAIATCISIAVINLVRLLEVYIIYKIHPYNKGYICGIVSMVISAVVLYFLDEYMPYQSPVIRIVANAIIISAIFVTPYIIMGTSEEDKQLFGAITKKFKIKIPLARS